MREKEPGGDGLEFVVSGTAMLDTFVMFWVLAGFGCLVIARDRSPRLTARSPGLRAEGLGRGWGSGGDASRRDFALAC